MTLALTSYDSITWEVTAGPGTVLEKVILCGYHRQAIKGLPKEVEVVEAFREDRKGDVSLAYSTHRLDSPEFRALAEALHRKTGLHVSSFFGTYRAEPERPVVVDRVQNDPRLAADWPTPTLGADLPKLTFQAMHLTPGNHGHETTLAYGDFTLSGPKMDSLKQAPHGVWRLTYDPDGKKHYGVADAGHTVVEVDLNRRSVKKLDLGLDVPRLNTPTDLTIDTKRKRLLLCATGCLYSYSLTAGKWSVLADNFRVVTMAYHPGEDALYGVQAEREGNPILVKFNPEGAVLQRTALEGPIHPASLPRGPGMTGNQLIHADGRLVLLMGPGGHHLVSSELRVPLKRYVYLVDPKSGKVQLTWKDPPTAVRTEAALDGGVAVKPGKVRVEKEKSDRELHVIGLYEGFEKSNGKIHGGKALVTVNRPNKRVTLALSAYSPITWEVTAAPGTTLEKVFLSGYYRQAVKGLPKEVEVVEAFREDRKGDLSLAFYTYRIDSGPFRSLVEALHQKTGLKVSSFFGTYRADPERPVVIDRVQDDPRLSPDYPVPTPLADLPKLGFKAIHYTAGRFPHDAEASSGEFTLGGAKLDSLKPLPGGAKRLAFDADSKMYYGIAGSGLVEVDLEKRSVRKIEASLDVPRISWPTDVTFDTKRKRVILLARGLLYAYEPGSKKWSALTEGLQAVAITYDPKDDTLYAIREEREATPSLLQLNPEGAVVRTMSLSGPIAPGVVARGSVVNGTQLVAVDGHVVLLVAPFGMRGSEEEGLRWSYVYLIDPASGKARLTWKGK